MNKNEVSIPMYLRGLYRGELIAMCRNCEQGVGFVPCRGKLGAMNHGSCRGEGVVVDWMFILYGSWKAMAKSCRVLAIYPYLFQKSHYSVLEGRFPF